MRNWLLWRIFKIAYVRGYEKGKQVALAEVKRNYIYNVKEDWK
jgi:hypothetical protein